MIHPWRLLLLLLPLALAMALACLDDKASLPNGGTEVPGTALVQLGESFDLNVGETIRSENGKWSLTLVAMPSDSRCPADVTCIWAGEVTVTLISTQGGRGEVELSLTLGPTGLPSSAFNQFRVTLRTLSPSPIAEQTIPQNEYVVTMVVEGETSPPATSGIRGAVSLGPQCPVEREGEPCPDKPYQAKLVVLNAAGKQVATTESGPLGNYALALSPGIYRVVPQTPADKPFSTAAAFEVVLETGGWTVVDIRYDTGIR